MALDPEERIPSLAGRWLMCKRQNGRDWGAWARAPNTRPRCCCCCSSNSSIWDLYLQLLLKYLLLLLLLLVTFVVTGNSVGLLIHGREVVRWLTFLCRYAPSVWPTSQASDWSRYQVDQSPAWDRGQTDRVHIRLASPANTGASTILFYCWTDV